MVNSSLRYVLSIFLNFGISLAENSYTEGAKKVRSVCIESAFLALKKLSKFVMLFQFFFIRIGYVASKIKLLEYVDYEGRFFLVVFAYFGCVFA